MYLANEETFDEEVDDLLRMGGVYAGLPVNVNCSSLLVATLSGCLEGLNSCFELWEVPFIFFDGDMVSVSESCCN